MATIVLTAVGGLIGGPIGAAIGSFAGQQIDASLLGAAKSREGPRLKDLAITTSSYGSPIARHFGVMRVPGTIIWSTDLIETRQTSGGGKGKPKTTTYSYRASFAVALGSRPIVSVGRIWADGNLLRGAAGDLKTPGAMRVYNGYGDQPVDPLIASAKGASAPAFRGTAYVVFEDLELGNFGNRIPALTFEIYADAQSQVALGQIVPDAQLPATDAALAQMLGYSDEGGSLLSALSAIDLIHPMICNAGVDAVEIQSAYTLPAQIPLLPQALADNENSGDQAAATVEHRRASADRPLSRALRYYDRDRDHQPGIQRTLGREQLGREETIDLPATMSSSGAKTLCSEYALRSRWQAEQIVWHIAELDPTIRPGDLVQVPGLSGTWLIKRWEWSDQGIELALERVPPATGLALQGDSGELYPPADLQPLPTILRAFELPWDGTGSSTSPAMFAAMSATAPNWSGAALYLEQGDALLPLDITSRTRCAMGSLANDLTPSSSIYLDTNGSCEIDLVAGDLELSSTTVARLSAGSNRMRIGGEIIQFLHAEQISATRWHISGLLRGRGGTEHIALGGHAAGTSIVLLDDALTPLDPAQIPSNTTTRLAAIGFGDVDPVYASLESVGVTRRPLSPVHTDCQIDPAGNWNLKWTRRARGQWQWDDHVDIPLVEENESYLVGVGPIDQPMAFWQVSDPNLTIENSTALAMVAEYGSQQVWVRQIGTFGQSPATLITTLN